VQKPVTQTPLLPQSEFLVQAIGTQSPPVHVSAVPQSEFLVQVDWTHDLYEFMVQLAA
jgi:hypothetical protein